MAGRRPINRQLKLLRGNPGRRPIPLDEPMAVPGSPDKPPYLSDWASTEWDRLLQLLEREQRLSKADGPHLEGAAIAYQAAMEYRRKARQRGLAHDEWRRFKTGERIQWDVYRKFCNDLCLSQGTRARARTGGRGKEGSKLSAFLRRPLGSTAPGHAG
jgi:hypothetical protein